MTNHHTPELAELASLFALDALEEPELTIVQGHIESCELCQAEVQGVHATMGQLASAGHLTPSPDVRRNVLDRIGDTPQQQPGINIRETTSPVAEDRPSLRSVPSASAPASTPARRPPSRRWAPIAAIAAALVLIAGAAGVLLTGNDDLTRAEEIAATDDSRTVELASADNDGEPEITFVFARSTGEGVLVASGLDPVADDQTYEFWLIDGDGAHPAGLFRPDNDGRVELDVEGVDVDTVTVGITVEPAEGSETPTGDVIFASDLT